VNANMPTTALVTLSPHLTCNSDTVLWQSGIPFLDSAQMAAAADFFLFQTRLMRWKLFKYLSQICNWNNTRRFWEPHPGAVYLHRIQESENQRTFCHATATLGQSWLVGWQH